MNELIYTLCQKPVIGLALFLTNSCGFSNVFDKVPIDLSSAGNVVSHEFKISVEKKYFLELVFNYKNEKNTSESIQYLVGEGGFENCTKLFNSKELAIEAKAAKGFSFPLEIEIKNIDQPKYNQHFYISSSCSRIWKSFEKNGFESVGKPLSDFYLIKGRY